MIKTCRSHKFSERFGRSAVEIKHTLRLIGDHKSALSRTVLRRDASRATVRATG